MSAVEPLTWRRTPAKRKAHQLATTLRQERPDYAYLKEVFRQLRTELGIVVSRAPKHLPYVPSEQEIRRYYETVWKTRKLGDLVLIKTLLYTGVRVSELVAIRLNDVDFDRCQVRINEGKGRKTGLCRSRRHSRKRSRCITIGCGNAGPATCLNPRGRNPTAIVASADSSSAMRQAHAWPIRSRPIGYGNSC